MVIVSYFEMAQRINLFIMSNTFKSRRDGLPQGAARSGKRGNLLPQAYHPHPVFSSWDSADNPRGT